MISVPRKIDLPSELPESVPYLYFQAPGGQCFQLLPIDEDQAYYKGAGDGLNATNKKAAEALKEKAMSDLALGYHRRNLQSLSRPSRTAQFGHAYFDQNLMFILVSLLTCALG